MDNRPLIFIDSGIGGLPYCREFLKNNENESVYYVADRKNFPYGTHKKEELSSILNSLTEKLIKKYDPKIIILACNTATISAVADLRNNFPQIPFVGTVPALKPAASRKYNRIGVLGTALTIEDIKSLHLVDDTCEIIGIAASELVEFVELRFNKADETEKKEIVRKYIERFKEADVKTIVLGCTHFLFLLDEFRNEAAPDIEVFDSIAGITKRIEFLLDENDCLLRCGKNNKPSYNLISTDIKADNSSLRDLAQSMNFNYLPNEIL